MLRSFLTITLRILWRNKVTSFVNIFSLSVGITSFILIMLYVHHETKYDMFHENYDNIYRLEGDDYAKLPPVIGEHIKERIPEIQDVVHIVSLSGAGLPTISYRPDHDPENFKYTKTDVVLADSTIFNVFTFPFIQGNPSTAVDNKFTAVISENTADILFGDDSPMGKTIEFSDHKFEITGVIRNVKNSHLEIGVIISMTSFPYMFPGRDLNFTGGNTWLWSATYFLTAANANENTLEKKINKNLEEINDGNLFDTIFKQFHVRPLKEIYFFGALRNHDYGSHGNFKMIMILLAVGVFMLVLACVNYVNLTTARSVIRTKEVAVKRFVGSSVTLIRLQLMIESIIVSIVSFVVALTIIQIFIEKFNEVAMANIRLEEWNRPDVWLVVLASTIALGLIAGIYPAFYLTAVKPVRLMKSSLLEIKSSFSPRSLLMTFQFTLSVTLIICALVNLQQLNFLSHANLGFNKEQIIQLETPADFEQEFVLRETFKSELLQSSNVLGVSYSAGTPGGFIPTHPIDFEGKQNTQELFLVDQDYFKVMDIAVLEGRAFQELKLSDFETKPGKLECLVNEAFTREFGFDSPIGKVFYSETPHGRLPFEIIGVVKDFHIRSLHHKIGPMNFVQAPPMYMANIKAKASDMQGTLNSIRKAWQKVYGDRVFTFYFLDENFEHQYTGDEQFATIISWFTALALLIACLGLFALSSFMITRRTKEIGIRKSMGASIQSIYTMLSWDFLKWIVLAVILACPLAWYVTQLWLSKFAYHVELGIDIFIIGSGVAFAVALFTVTWQSLKAANANPVKSLRYE